MHDYTVTPATLDRAMRDADPNGEGYFWVMFNFAGILVRKDQIEGYALYTELEGLSDGQIAELLRDRWIQAHTEHIP